MEAKVLLLIALFAPILMLGSGIFAGRKSDRPSLEPTHDRLSS